MSLGSEFASLLRTIRQQGLSIAAKTVRDFLIYRLYQRFQVNDGLLLKEIQGSKMYLDVNDTGLARRLAIHGIREEIHTRVIRQELEEGMAVLDIGANIGYYVLIEASIVGERGTVYAMEPCPRNAALLDRNIKLNGYSGIVQTYRMAASDKSGKATLYLSEKWNQHTMLNPEEYDYHADIMTNRCIEVPATTLDDFLKDKKPVGLMRMDVEGHEIEILDGMRNTLRSDKAPAKILLETHPWAYTRNHSLKPRLEMLLSCGYEPKAIMVDHGTRPEALVELGYEPDIVMNILMGQASYRVSADDFIKLECPPNPQALTHHWILLQKRLHM